MSSILRIVRIPIDGTNWTPIPLPCDCQAFWFRCDDSKIKIRTDPVDPTTEDIFNAGVQFVVPFIRGTGGTWRPRFLQGDISGYIQSSGFMGGGEEDLILTCVLK